MTDITEADVTALRQQNDLKAFIQDTNRQAAARCAARVRLVAHHPDLVEQVAAVLGHPNWNGYLAPDTDCTGRINTSPIRRRLAAILAEAEQRGTTTRSVA
ncbi:hypothetical protein [Streptomyces sp. NBC_01268]|uniref:hypothetical protein n=1 Tax=Streptomyces sp. NBC_01268 TaxID=2903806 RepID=UPI002E2EE239|nr:hypothetical protein [Streptomyces sp. NBC_01268]